MEWRFPPYLVLLRVGFALPVASLPRRCALTAPFHPYPDVVLNPLRTEVFLRKHRRRLTLTRIHNDAGAVCFLWHFPSTGLEPGLPDVIRHTALRSSDFPPHPFSKEHPRLDAPPRMGGATVRSGCLRSYYMRPILGFGAPLRSTRRSRTWPVRLFAALKMAFPQRCREPRHLLFRICSCGCVHV